MTTQVYPGNYSSLAQIAEHVRQAAFEAGFDSATIYQIETAVDEACSNIIEHAYRGESENSIEVTSLISAENLTFILKDHGFSFNPQTVKTPNIKAPLKDRDEHGLGLYFMRQWMDEIRFERQNSANILFMIKYLPH